MYEEIAAKIAKKGLCFEELDSSCLKISLVCPRKKGAAKFFYDFVTRSLVPGKEVEVVTHFAMQYESLTVAELILKLECVEDLDVAKSNWPFLKNEILLGTSSLYHAKKILELRGLSFDEKAVLVQEKLGLMMKRFPDHFESDIFRDMQCLFLATSENFKKTHAPTELARIIFTLYLFRKSLEKRMGKNPNRRHLALKCRRGHTHTTFGLKSVLSVFVGLSFLKEHEIFEEKHLQLALNYLVPDAQVVAGSYFSFDACFYIEFERAGPFSKEEILELEKRLPSEIRARIEQLVSPVFMPRNEEEVMRNILTLSGELKYLRDLPQVMISFYKQTEHQIIFTVTLVRVLHNSPQIQEAENLTIDRIKTVGLLRQKYPKEAVVMKISLPMKNFIREDFSVDLFAARLQVVKEVEKIVGEVRDYNGGMIAKQSENFAQLKTLLGDLAIKHPLFLQNFFHSIFPASLSATIEPEKLKILFEMLLEKGESQREVDGQTFMVCVGEAPKELEPVLQIQMQIEEVIYTAIIAKHLTFAPDSSYLDV